VSASKNSWRFALKVRRGASSSSLSLRQGEIKPIGSRLSADWRRVAGSVANADGPGVRRFTSYIKAIPTTLQVAPVCLRHLAASMHV